MLQEEKSFGSTHKPIEPLGIKSHWAISFHRSESDNHVLIILYIYIVSQLYNTIDDSHILFWLNMSRIFKHYSVNSTTLLDWKRQLLGAAVNNPRLYETIEHFCLGRRQLGN